CLTAPGHPWATQRAPARQPRSQVRAGRAAKFAAFRCIEPAAERDAEGENGDCPPLRILTPSLTIRRYFGDLFGGIHVIAPTLCACCGARPRAVDWATADKRLRLYGRGTAGLHARRHAALRRLHSGCRPNYSLHDPEQVAALAGMRALFSAGTCARRSRFRP